MDDAGRLSPITCSATSAFNGVGGDFLPTYYPSANIVRPPHLVHVVPPCRSVPCCCYRFLPAITLATFSLLIITPSISGGHQWTYRRRRTCARAATQISPRLSASTISFGRRLPSVCSCCIRTYIFACQNLNSMTFGTLQTHLLNTSNLLLIALHGVSTPHPPTHSLLVQSCFLYVHVHTHTCGQHYLTCAPSMQAARLPHPCAAVHMHCEHLFFMPLSSLWTRTGACSPCRSNYKTSSPFEHPYHGLGYRARGAHARFMYAGTLLSRTQQAALARHHRVAPLSSIPSMMWPLLGRWSRVLLHGPSYLLPAGRYAMSLCFFEDILFIHYFEHVYHCMPFSILAYGIVHSWQTWYLQTTLHS